MSHQARSFLNVLNVLTVLMLVAMTMLWWFRRCGGAHRRVNHQLFIHFEKEVEFFEERSTPATFHPTLPHFWRELGRTQRREREREGERRRTCGGIKPVVEKIPAGLQGVKNPCPHCVFVAPLHERTFFLLYSSRHKRMASSVASSEERCRSSELPGPLPTQTEDSRDAKLAYLRSHVDPVMVPLLETIMKEKPADVEAWMEKRFNRTSLDASESPVARVSASTLRMHGLSFLLPPKFPEIGATPALLSELLNVPNLPGRPCNAVGTWLRVVTINDVYKLEHYAQYKTAVSLCKGMATAQVTRNPYIEGKGDTSIGGVVWRVAKLKKKKAIHCEVSRPNKSPLITSFVSTTRNHDAGCGLYIYFEWRLFVALHLDVPRRRYRYDSGKILTSARRNRPSHQ